MCWRRRRVCLAHAEGAGFEPAPDNTGLPQRGQRLQPLGHPSVPSTVELSRMGKAALAGVPVHGTSEPWDGQRNSGVTGIASTATADGT